MKCASLDDLLAKMRAGGAGGKHAPSIPSARSMASRLPPRGTYTAVEELDEDDWNDDDSDAIVYIAPKQLAHVSQHPNATADTTSKEIKTCIDHAIALKRKALDIEKSRAFQDALELYAEAGYMFLRAGRSTPSGALQNALKMEAFSLLTHAERLERWTDRLKHASCRGSGLNVDTHIGALVTPPMRHLSRCPYSQQTSRPGPLPPRP